ncbi:hypothetical protein ASD83_10865 [Devosia sp. Root685]|uniref:hypothetical protein n=1 Tax=Devosia sp. Root685 TaxID=1736587 RepID=UPI0006F5DB6D|nr:hypothetical protein [Devosia sp. Root685]KRA97612.1 hypothetical protein ASD83_10865 [Devosia sp. Root685]
MALTSLQKDVMAVIAANRSDTSYMAGGAVLNEDWFRLSDDLDIFHDTDEEIVATAQKDMASLTDAGFKVNTDVLIYGVVECTVSRGGDATILQWMSETRYRYFPLVRDAEWGVRLNTADLAVNKVGAASTRTKARDYVDLVTIEERFSPLGPLVLAASGKPPNFSPQKIIEEIRRRSHSVPDEDYLSVRGLPAGVTAANLRDRLTSALDRAEAYIQTADLSLVGALSVDEAGKPVAALGDHSSKFTIRRATDEVQAVPTLRDEPSGFERG